MPSPHPRTVLIVPALVLALLVPTLESAWAQQREVKLSGMGVRKCAEWQQWKEAGNNEMRAMTLEWTQGFIAGHNVYARTGTASVSPVVATATVLIPLLDSFCLKNPEERILVGVIEITKNLGGTKVDLKPKVPPPRNPQPERKDKLES